MLMNMKTKLESILASFTIGLIVLFLVMVAGNVFGQDQFLCAMGTSIPQAKALLVEFPNLRVVETQDAIQFGCDGFTADYQFEDGKLKSLQLQRKFHSARLANASLEIHMIFIERSGATFFSLSTDSKTKTYCAVDDHAGYELRLVEEPGGAMTVKIRAWMRAAPQEGTLSAATFTDELPSQFQVADNNNGNQAVNFPLAAQGLRH